MAGFFGRLGVLGPLLAVVAAVLVAVGVMRLAQPSAPAETPAPGPVSVIEACQLPGSNVKAGATIDYKWHLLVRLDSPMESVLLFASGSNRFLCDATRGPDGTYASVITSTGGGFEPEPPAALTYDDGTIMSPGQTYPSQLVVGQVPAGTAWVDVVTADGEHHDATIGNGWYMAWAAVVDPSDRVVEIDAHDSTSKIIASLADPNGLGSSPEPAST
jgi:hypothetical protein